VLFIRAGMNVSSVTDRNIGRYTANFQYPLADLEYATCGTAVIANTASYGADSATYATEETVNSAGDLVQKTTTANAICTTVHGPGRYVDGKHMNFTWVR
jgi:hypothetical protein